MTKALASLVLALSVASIFVPPCVCGLGAAATAEPGCHGAEPGVGAHSMGCGCACLSSAPATQVTLRVAPVVVDGAGAHAVVPLATDAPRPFVTIASPRPASSPPGHQILRV